jgi:hypothetical protein
VNFAESESPDPMRRLPRFCLIFMLACFSAGLTGFVSAALAAQDVRTALAVPDATVESIPLQRDDLNAFYSVHNFSPVWNFSGTENHQTFVTFLDSIQQVIDYHGLDPSAYPLDVMRRLEGSADDADHNKLELLVTDSLLRLAHELHGDGDELEHNYVGWTFHRTPLDIPALLAAAVEAHSLGEFFGGLSPHHPAYATLARALQTYHGIASKGGWPLIDTAQPLPLKPKQSDPRIAGVRSRLQVEGLIDPTQSDTAASAPETIPADMYDDGLVRAVKEWQARYGLDADGLITPKTLAAMNIRAEDRVNQIRANMERWRHMPDAYPPLRYIAVNIASAEVNIFEGGERIYRSPVVVGRVDRKTPFIDSEVRSMIINPFWHVPIKIAQKDILPKLRKDPHYLEKLGFVISGHADDPTGANINWNKMSDKAFNFRLRQEPGDQNSLGRLKFDFENDFAVYMHGTPHQNLFSRAQRNYSSGCVRLSDPVEVAEILLASNHEPMHAEAIEAAIDTDKTHWIGFAKPIPIYILYWTVFADDSGAINFRKDVYGYDAMLGRNEGFNNLQKK